MQTGSVDDGSVDEDPGVLRHLNSSIVDYVRLQADSELRRSTRLREDSKERLQKLERQVC